MFETQMTVVGKLVTGVDQRRFADGSVVANFRVVSTERRYDRDARTWANGDRLFLDVTCWRRLAENTFASLVKGDNVVVTGRLYTREFEHEGRRRSTVTLEAQSVAADLAWCTAVLTRTDRRSAPAPGREAGGEVGADAGASDGSPTRADDHPVPLDDVSAARAVAGAVDDAGRLVGAAPGGEG
jgi:single-strand DNA-binding protein